MTITTTLDKGNYFHIYNRGNNGDLIFYEEEDYSHFIKLMIKYICPIVEIYCYCLLNNHFHLLVRIKEAEQIQKEGKLLNPKQCFSNLFNAYARWFNLRNKRTGKLFAERFKRKEITDGFYFTDIISYIHTNPQNHHIIKDFRNYPYSSYPSIISNKPTFLKRKEVLEWFGGSALMEGYHLDRAKFNMQKEAFKFRP